MTLVEYIRNLLNIGSTSASAADRNSGRNSGTGYESGDSLSNRESFLGQLFGQIVGNLGGIISSAVTRLDSSPNSAVGSLVNKFTGRALTGAEREANEFSAQQAQAQMDFQERMANTQFQRGVADMQAAGVNPALAVSQGGAVAPTGASASSVQPQSGMSMSDLVALMTLKPQLDLLKAQENKTNEEANRTRQEANKLGKETAWIDTLNQANLEQIRAATNLAKSEYRLNENERKALLVAEKVATQNKSALENAELFYQEWKNAFIAETGMDPSASVLGQLFQNSITNLGKALEHLFPKEFHFNFTNLELPHKS